MEVTYVRTTPTYQEWRSTLTGRVHLVRITDTYTEFPDVGQKGYLYFKGTKSRSLSLSKA